MAKNIFELIILGEGDVGLVPTTFDISSANMNFHDWTPDGTLNPNGTYLMPDGWNFYPLEPLPEILGDIFLELYNEEFEATIGGFPTLSSSVGAMATNNNIFGSMWNFGGWIATRYTVGNNGLDATGGTEVEDDTTPGYSYYGADQTLSTDRLAPDLLIYGADQTPQVVPQRVGNVWSPRYIPDFNDAGAPSNTPPYNSTPEAYLSDRFYI